MTTLIETMARAICKSQTCEGFECCEWPANYGRKGKCPVTRGGYDSAARAALSAIEAAGRRVVPVNPTLAQCVAGETAIRNIPRTGVVPEETEEAQDCYAAMLAAAPKVTDGN